MNKTFAFFGTPEVASSTLTILAMHGYKPRVIVTSPNRRAGRGMQMAETDVSLWANEHGIECLKPEKIDKDFIENFKKYNVDLSIVIAYGKILPEELIKLPPLGTINIHYSLLPKYRGASPVEEALLHGDEVTGISIQKMEYKLDSGAVLVEEVVPIDKDEVKTDLLKRLTEIGGKLLAEKLPDIFGNKIIPKTQDESGATFCKKLKKEDGLIDLSDDAKINYNKYRALEGWPGTYFFINKESKNIRMKIRKASYENGSFTVERVIPEGKKEIDYSEFIRNKN